MTAPAVRSPSTVPRCWICTIRANISAADADWLSTSTASRPVNGFFAGVAISRVLRPPRRVSTAITTS